MFIVRSGGFGAVAKANFGGKTGMLVSTAEIGGELVASKHSTEGGRPNGFFYIDPQTKSRANLALGAPGQANDTFVSGEYGVVVSQSGTALTDQLEDGIYEHGTKLASKGNGLLKVASPGTPPTYSDGETAGDPGTPADFVVAEVLHGNVIGNTDGTLVEIKFSL